MFIQQLRDVCVYYNYSVFFEIIATEIIDELDSVEQMRLKWLVNKTYSFMLLQSFGGLPANT